LTARARDADRVAFLEGVLADGVRRNLAREHHHRDRIHVRRGNAGHGVGHSRSARDERYAALAGGSRVSVGRMDGALLMANQDVLHILLPEDGVVEVQHRPTRIAEYELDTLGLEAADDDFGAGQRLAGRDVRG